MPAPILTGRVLGKRQRPPARRVETDLWAALQAEAACTREMVRDRSLSPRALAMAGARIARITQAMERRTGGYR